MVTTLLKLIKKIGLAKLPTQEIHLSQWTHLLFVKSYTIDWQVLNLKFFIYSIIYFINWNKFIASNGLFIWFILEENDVLFIQKLISEQFFNFVLNIAWIPGLLSNPDVIMGGSRYQAAVEKKQIQVRNWIQIAFFCTIQNSAIIKEMNSCLIPSIVPLNNVLNSNYYDSIPVFVFKHNRYSMYNWDKTVFTSSTIVKKKIKQIYFKQHNISKNLYIFNLLSQKLWFFYILLLNFYLKKNV